MPSLPSCSDYSTSIVVCSLVKASQLAGGKPRADALLFSLIIKGITKKKYYLYT